MNKTDFRKITEMLEENYSKKMDIRILNLWYEEFKEYPVDEYEKLIIEAIKTKKFMPTLAEIRELKREMPSWFGVDVKIKIPAPDQKKIMEELLKEFCEEEK